MEKLKMPDEKIIELLDKIYQLNQLLIPILLILVVIGFIVFMRGLTWFCDEHDKNEELRYKRLREKFKDDDK